MRRRIPPVEFSHGEPPQELLRFAPRTSSEWMAPDFAAWLRARAAWRHTYAEPLPALLTLERSALTRLDLPAALVEAVRSSPRGGSGLLPEVVRPSAVDGDTRQGAGE